MDNFLILSGSILTIVAILPYLRGVIAGRIRPRIVTWFTWTIINGIACLASLSDGKYPAAILMFCATVEVFLVVLFGYRRGIKEIGKLDIVCQIGALVGLSVWVTTRSASLAIWSMIVTDLVAATPTIRHCYLKPKEEGFFTFILSAAGSMLVLFAVDTWTATSVGFLVYTVLLNMVFCSLILIGLRIGSKKRADLVIENYVIQGDDV